MGLSHLESALNLINHHPSVDDQEPTASPGTQNLVVSLEQQESAVDDLENLEDPVYLKDLA